MKGLIFSVLFLCGTLLSAQAKTDSLLYLNSVGIRTGGGVMQQELAALLQLREKSRDTREGFEKRIRADSASLHTFLFERAYPGSEVQVERIITADTNLSLIFDIREGKQLLLDSITVRPQGEISPLLTNKIAGLIPAFRGEPATHENIERLIERLLLLLEEQGHTFGSAAVEELTADSSGARLLIGLNPGAKARIREVTVLGNNETKEDVVKALAVIPYEELYSETLAEQIRRRLLKTRIFSSVELPKAYLLPDGNLGIQIRVTESNPNTIDGIIGYSEQKAAVQANPLSGIVNLELRNLFGTARRFRFRWLSDHTSSQELYAEYSEPLVFGLPLSLGASFSQRQQDTIFSREHFSLNSSFFFSEGIDISASLFTEKVSPSAVEEIGFTVYESRQNGLSGEISFDTRENFVNPRSGLFYTTGFTVSEKNITGPQKFLDSLMPARRLLRRRVSLNGGNYFSFFDRQVEYIHAHFQSVSGDALEESEVLRLGGRNSIRGYPENFFPAQQAFWAGIEHRLLLSENSFLGLFIDAGTIRFPELRGRTPSASPDFLLGYGLTGQFETPLGLVLLSLGLGRDDAFSQAKVSVGLNTAF